MAWYTTGKSGNQTRPAPTGRKWVMGRSDLLCAAYERTWTATDVHDRGKGFVRNGGRPMRVGIYARSATGDASQLREQEERCRNYAATRGWTVTDVWADGGSGLSENRPGFRALREAIATRQIDTVVATDLARFARDLPILVRQLEHAELFGVEVSTVEGYVSGGKDLGIRALLRVLSSAGRDRKPRED
jgi:hypothetical protein